MDTPWSHMAPTRSLTLPTRSWQSSQLQRNRGPGLLISSRLVGPCFIHFLKTLLIETAVKYIPSWFPGAEFQRMAKTFNSRVNDFSGKPYAFVQKKMARGSYKPSYLSRLLEKDNPQPGSEEELVARWSAASLYGGGSDTVSDALNIINCDISNIHRHFLPWAPSSSRWPCTQTSNEKPKRKSTG